MVGAGGVSGAGLGDGGGGGGLGAGGVSGAGLGGGSGTGGSGPGGTSGSQGRGDDPGNVGYGHSQGVAESTAGMEAAAGIGAMAGAAAAGGPHVGFGHSAMVAEHTAGFEAAAGIGAFGDPTGVGGRGPSAEIDPMRMIIGTELDRALMEQALQPSLSPDAFEIAHRTEMFERSLVMDHAPGALGRFAFHDIQRALVSPHYSLSDLASVSALSPMNFARLGLAILGVLQAPIMAPVAMMQAFSMLGTYTGHLGLALGAMDAATLGRRGMMIGDIAAMEIAMQTNFQMVPSFLGPAGMIGGIALGLGRSASTFGAEEGVDPSAGLAAGTGDGRGFQLMEDRAAQRDPRYWRSPFRPRPALERPERRRPEGPDRYDVVMRQMRTRLGFGLIAEAPTLVSWISSARGFDLEDRPFGTSTPGYKFLSEGADPSGTGSLLEALSSPGVVNSQEVAYMRRILQNEAEGREFLREQEPRGEISGIPGIWLLDVDVASQEFNKLLEV